MNDTYAVVSKPKKPLPPPADPTYSTVAPPKFSRTLPLSHHYDNDPGGASVTPVYSVVRPRAKPPLVTPFCDEEDHLSPGSSQTDNNYEDLSPTAADVIESPGDIGRPQHRPRSRPHPQGSHPIIIQTRPPNPPLPTRLLLLPTLPHPLPDSLRTASPVRARLSGNHGNHLGNQAWRLSRRGAQSETGTVVCPGSRLLPGRCKNYKVSVDTS
ncbi:tyrosine-protein phosphatase non-receptor type 18 isoform 2-T5 [Spinachia spinachia]